MSADTKPESGYYWAYTLSAIGNYLEPIGQPNIVYYCAEDNHVEIFGCEYDFDVSSFKLLRPVVYSPSEEQI